MSVTQEIEMLKKNIAIIKTRMAHAQSKREFLLLKDELHTTHMELVMAQAEAKNGFSLATKKYKSATNS